MARHFNLVSSLRTIVVTAAFLSQVAPVRGGEPPAVEAKPKGPEHNVTLAEEPAVLELLAKAQKARVRAEKDPEVWPECVKYYGEILRKYPNSVYLDRWEGPEKTDLAYKNGLYKSTRERVAQDIASLPTAGLAIYRVVSDPPARALYQEAQNEFDARKMEQVAQVYFPTSWGDDALAWLAETAHDRLAPREVVVRAGQALKHPSLSVSRIGLLIRMLLAQADLGNQAAAEQTLQELTALAPTAKEGELRAGHVTGPAALEKLKARVASAQKGPVAQPVAAAGRSWPTYFGNAAHNRVPAARRNVGLRKWSVPIMKLLYGPNADAPVSAKVVTNDGTPIPDPTINYHLAVQDGFFYLCNNQLVVSYPVGNPQPGQPTGGGNAKFVYPSDVQPPPKPSGRDSNQVRRFGGRYVQSSLRHHPYFCTIAADRLFLVRGAEAAAADPDMVVWGGRQEQPKPPTNHLVALGRQGATGTLESGKLVWSLEPAGHSQAFESQSKADQEWLKSVFFVSSPTYDSGMLYTLAVHMSGMHEAWVAAFDADNGRLVWRTSVCSANPVLVSGVVQLDLGLPVAVSGGTVFAVTNLGAVAALDAMSGSIKWIRIYDRMAVNVDRFNRGMRTATDFWGPNPPVVWDNVVYVTPQDSELLYAYDVETGRRVWHISRTERDPGLKHLLGITNGNLVVTGANVHFYELKGGRETGPAEPFSFDSSIKGRGLVTEDVVLVPTEKTLVSIDTSLVDGKFRPRLLGEHRWGEPEREAGNVFAAGDVLYTISNTHVNAYFVWEEMEARLKERIARETSDLGAYGELADVYHRVARYDQALSILDKALQVAEKLKDEPKAAAMLADLRRKRFDALMELGKTLQKGAEAERKLPAAYDYFKQALAAARVPGQAEALPVMALRAMAENQVEAGNVTQAVAHYQEIIAQHGDAIYAYVPESSAKARLFARLRIEELRKKDPASYAKIETVAQAALGEAGSDPQKLEALLAHYPNADVCGAALLKLAQLTLEKNPDQARQYAQRYLGAFRQSPDAPLATALLAVAYERGSLLGQAKEVLHRLATRPEFAGKGIPLDPAATPVGGAVASVKEWAEKRLAGPQFQRAPSAAVLALADGKLTRAWTATAHEQSVPLLTVGTAPQAMRRNLFYVENQTELAVLSGMDRGKELWLPRPRLPADCMPRTADNPMNAMLRFTTPQQSATGYWAEHLLLVAGAKEVLAYDSSDKGKVVWRKDLRTASGAPLPSQFQVANGRLVITYISGTLSVVDAMTGEELWTQNENGTIFGGAAVGDGFVAVATQNPSRIVIHDLETGARRAVVEAPGNITAAPVAQGDQLYFIERNSLLKAVDAATGKLLWEHEAGATVGALKAGGDLVVIVTEGRHVTALNATAKGERKRWAPVLPPGATVSAVLIDGEDLYVAANVPSKSNVPQQKLALLAYSVAEEGKFKWDVELASDPINAVPLSPQTVTTGHLLVTQSVWDPTGDKPTAVTLVARKTGLTTWSESLSSDGRMRDEDGVPKPAFRVQVFDGGVVVTESHKRTAYVAQDTRNLGETIAALAEQAAKNPNDLDLRGRLAAKRFDKGERESALKELSAIVGSAQLTPEQFVTWYAELARRRQQAAKLEKRTLVFTKVADGPKLDATPASWAAVPETVFDSWRDVFMPSDEETSGAIKKGAWAGSGDLKVSFRGAYDERNLYLLFVVTDDKHTNEATEGVCCDLGDSIRLVLDIDRDGGTGFRGEDFEIGACLNNWNAVLGWRWVEHGKYLRGETPLLPAPAIVRKEAEKVTIYKFTLPLDCLALKPEPGRKFGFSFAVNDQDSGNAVTKSICAGPGTLRSVNPSLFAEAVLEKK